MKTTRRARGARTLLSALALVGMSCSAVLNMDSDQCQVDADCIARFGTTQPFLCVDNVCERPLCSTDEACRSRGGTFQSSICDEQTGRCAAAECFDSTACSIGQACDTNTNRCVASNCQTTEQCFTNNNYALASPTVQCIGGLCVDLIWGCIGQGDNRAVPTGPNTLKVPIIDGTTGVAHPGAQFDVKACSLPSLDRKCDNPLGIGSYDQVTGLATINNLQASGSQLRIKIDPIGNDNIIPMDLYTPKSARGETTTAPVRLVFRDSLAALTQVIGGSGTTINASYGSYYGMFFDCQEKPAERMKLSVAEQGEEMTLPIYFTAENLPSLSQQYTSTSGLFSTLNVRPEAINTVTTTLVAELGSLKHDRTVNVYKIDAQPYRLTTVHFYARDYAK